MNQYPKNMISDFEARAANACSMPWLVAMGVGVVIE